MLAMNRSEWDLAARLLETSVAGDVFAPGWRAEIDGRRSDIREAYGVIRGVVVDAGRHRIEFSYRPASVYWGGALSLVGFLLAAVLVWHDRRLASPVWHDRVDVVPPLFW